MTRTARCSGGRRDQARLPSCVFPAPRERPRMRRAARARDAFAARGARTSGSSPPPRRSSRPPLRPPSRPAGERRGEAPRAPSVPPARALPIFLRRARAAAPPLRPIKNAFRFHFDTLLNTDQNERAIVAIRFDVCMVRFHQAALYSKTKRAFESHTGLRFDVSFRCQGLH